MKTAVEWLIDKWVELDSKFDSMLIDRVTYCEQLGDIHKQAKEMGKQQMIDARLKPLLLFKELRIKHGYFGGPDNGQVIDREINNSEQYYNQTFKSE
jgi:hypothetical protein